MILNIKHSFLVLICSISFDAFAQQVPCNPALETCTSKSQVVVLPDGQQLTIEKDKRIFLKIEHQYMNRDVRVLTCFSGQSIIIQSTEKKTCEELGLSSIPEYIEDQTNN